MRRVVLQFIVLICLLVFSSVVSAGGQFNVETTYIPGSNYTWTNDGFERVTWLTSYRGDYRISDRGTGVLRASHVLEFSAFVCTGSYDPVQCTKLPVSSNGTSGYFVTFDENVKVVFGHFSVPPEVSISPDSGDFSDYLDIVVSGTAGSSLYYSLDGSEPSIQYSSSIRITDTKTVKAKAVNAGGSSSVATKIYTKKVVHLSLTISPDTSSLDKPLDVSLIPSESDAVVYYSLDGSEPSIRYTGAVRIDRPLTLKAKAVKGDRESPVYQKVYKRPPIMHTDEKFFQIPVDLPAVVKGATDYISVASPGMWLFAVTFLGLLILAVAKKVFNK